MTNNLDAVLRSFNPQEIEEIKKKGIISLQDKGYVYKEEKPSNQFNQNNNLNLKFQQSSNFTGVSNRNIKNENTSNNYSYNITENKNLQINTGLMNSFNLNQNSNLKKNETLSNYNIRNDQNIQIQNQQKNSYFVNNYRIPEKNFNNNTGVSMNNLYSPKKEISSSAENEFSLLNNLDDIIGEYSEESKKEKNQKEKENFNKKEISSFNISSNISKNSKTLNNSNNLPKNCNIYNYTIVKSTENNNSRMPRVISDECEVKQITQVPKVQQVKPPNAKEFNADVNYFDINSTNSHPQTTNTYTTSMQPPSYSYDDNLFLDDDQIENLFIDHGQDQEDDIPNINAVNMNIASGGGSAYEKNYSGNNNYQKNNFQNIQNINSIQSNQNNYVNKFNHNVGGNNSYNFSYNNQNNFSSSNNQNYNNFSSSGKNNFSNNYNNNFSNTYNNFSGNNNNNFSNNNNNFNHAPNPNYYQNMQDPDDMQINNNGCFIEKACENHKIANLSEWGRSFDWDDLVDNANLRVFGYRTFRPNQREIINASLSGRDIFVCMPTGGGKSLTFQIPALISDGVTLVVMPLISLIEDQVAIMKGLGVKVIFLNQEGSQEIDTNFTKLFIEDSDERCKLIFVTPEKIAQSNRAMNFLRDLYERDILDRFVIDEAHCVSQWGREFRPDYLNLRVLRQNFPRVPLLAITATAPNKVREDIIAQLYMRDCLFFRSSYNRNNLYIEIRNKKDMSDVVTNMAQFIKKKYPDSSGLVYCSSRKECEQISEKLSKTHGLSAKYYHASMPEKEKSSVQEKWKNDEIKIIVATIAFGMGINKADVRYVIHHALPKSFENYYQEIGRAGRDGKKSHCLLYYNPADRRTLEFLMQKSGLNQNMVIQNLRKITEMIEYCEEFCECRRVIALLYFDEKFNRNDCGKMCDNCRKNLVKEDKDLTHECFKVLEFAKNCHFSNIDMTLNQVIDYLRGIQCKNKNKKTPSGDSNFGILKSVTNENLKKIIRRMIIIKLIDERLLTIADKCFAVISISNEGLDLLVKKKNIFKLILTFPKPVSSSSNNYEVENSNSNNLPGNLLERDNQKELSNRQDNRFISKNSDKDLDVYNYNHTEDVQLLSKIATGNKASLKAEEINNQKKERKYNRTKENEVENKRKSVNIQEEDYGYCTQEQFEELFEKLKIKRREILKVENKKIENENISMANSTHLDPNNSGFNLINPNQEKKKLTADEIFPSTGLKELCRKLPTSERELNSNYIFGVAGKFLQKYGKEFLPEIIKHVNLYQIDKSENKFNEVVNQSLEFSSKKKIYNRMNTSSHDNQLENEEVDYSYGNNLNLDKSTLKTSNNVIGSLRNMNRSNIKDFRDINNSIENRNDGQISNIKIIKDNNVAMFNSMSEKSNKKDIVIDLNSSTIKSNQIGVLSEFLKDIEKMSNEKMKKKENNQNLSENQVKVNSGLNNFFEDLEAFDNEYFNPIQKERNIHGIQNLNGVIQQDFNDFEDINVNSLDHLYNEDEDQDEQDEFNEIANQVKKMNKEMKQADKGDKKKRQRNEEDEDEVQEGEKRAKNNKNNYFKQRAIWNKMNKNKKKGNNFL